MRTNSQEAGDAAERLVVERLAGAGWTILGLNVHVGRAELDIVAVDEAPPARLVVIEVRTRRSREFGLPEETVDAAKRTRIRRAAQAIRERGVLADGTAVPALPLRIDLVVVEPPREPGGAVRIRHHVAAL
ncbi:MAG TPA: YraN family protein [Candidatus Sulfomarinibacteraceae bacterium]|nr:YraN family protein [Candidatus Sulfomarinibacteraceae bacterium]